MLRRILTIQLMVASSWAAFWSWQSSPVSPSQTVFRENCSISHYTAYEVYNGPIAKFRSGPLDPLYAPKLNPLNSTAGEQWEFDGIGDSAKTGVVIGFYRDPNYQILGTGNLRVSIDLLLENGTIYSQDHHVDHSIVEVCEEEVHGTWYSPGIKYAFVITRDQRYARVEIDTPNIKGLFDMIATAPARYPDGNLYPNEAATTQLSPFFHWLEGIPTGRMSMNLVVEGTAVAWQGLGGSEHLWTAFSWFTILDELRIIRSEIGSYQLTWYATKARIQTPGITYGTAVLAKDGKKIFSSTRGYVSAAEDYFTVSKKYGGKVTGSLADKATGLVLNLVSVEGEHYYFEFDFTAVSFEFALGEGTGGTGFAALAEGGKTGDAKGKGVALVEQLVFPKDSFFFKSNYA